MFIDALLRVCNAQAFTAVALSVGSIDLGAVTPKRRIATGEPMGFALAVGVAADCTTVLVEVVNATTGDLGTGLIVLSQRTFLAADMPAGALHFMPLPQAPTAAGPLEFIGLRITPAGGNATVTITAWLTTHSLFSMAAQHYAKGYTIS